MRSQLNSMEGYCTFLAMVFAARIIWEHPYSKVEFLLTFGFLLALAEYIPAIRSWWNRRKPKKLSLGTCKECGADCTDFWDGARCFSCYRKT